MLGHRSKFGVIFQNYKCLFVLLIRSNFQTLICMGGFVMQAPPSSNIPTDYLLKIPWRRELKDYALYPLFDKTCKLQHIFYTAAIPPRYLLVLCSLCS